MFIEHAISCLPRLLVEAVEVVGMAEVPEVAKEVLEVVVVAMTQILEMVETVGIANMPEVAEVVEAMQRVEMAEDAEVVAMAEVAEVVVEMVDMVTTAQVVEARPMRERLTTTDARRATYRSSRCGEVTNLVANLDWQRQSWLRSMLGSVQKCRSDHMCSCLIGGGKIVLILELL